MAPRQTVILRKYTLNRALKAKVWCFKSNGSHHVEYIRNYKVVSIEPFRTKKEALKRYNTICLEANIQQEYGTKVSEK